MHAELEFQSARRATERVQGGSVQTELGNTRVAKSPKTTISLLNGLLWGVFGRGLSDRLGARRIPQLQRLQRPSECALTIDEQSVSAYT